MVSNPVLPTDGSRPPCPKHPTSLPLPPAKVDAVPAAEPECRRGKPELGLVAADPGTRGCTDGKAPQGLEL